MVSQRNFVNNPGFVAGLLPQAVESAFHATLQEALVKTESRPLVFFTPDLSDKKIEVPPCDGEGGEGVISNPYALQFYVYDGLRALEQQGVDVALLPCFFSQAFLKTLSAETSLPIISLMDALLDYVGQRVGKIKTIGLLVSPSMQENKLFEEYFHSTECRLLYQAIPASCALTKDEIAASCQALIDQGAQVIIPAIPSLFMADMEPAFDQVLIKVGKMYANYVAAYLAKKHPRVAKEPKIGVVGGVGPAATVDFLDKIVKNSPAKTDQEHIKIVVEQNPQIPDRTANLMGKGPDPTLAIYAACQRLQADDATMIAIPCNTAHAFIDRIVPFLSIPVVSMPAETAKYICSHYPARKKIGLLSTLGTARSQVYHRVIEQAGLELMVPDEVNQQKVMAAIYGERGVKAGYTEGQCREDLLEALVHLVERGSEVAILACTELPLILAQSDDFKVAGKSVVLLDPTEILAKACVHRAKAGLLS